MSFRILRGVGAPVLILVLAIAGALGFYLGAHASAEKGEEDERVLAVRPSTSVVTALRELAQLQGAEFHLERVVDVKEKQSRYFGMIEAEDALLLVAAGDVTAGVDLRDVTDVRVTEQEGLRSVVVRLPAARVLTSKLDNERTYVHTRSTDLMAERQINLESRARKIAEDGFVEAAVSAGILKTAEASIEKTITSLLHGLGFAEVRIEFEKAEFETTGAKGSSSGH